MPTPPTPGRGYTARTPPAPGQGQGNRTSPASSRGRYTSGRRQGNRPPPTPESGERVRPRLQTLSTRRPPAPIATAAQPSPQAQGSTPFSMPESGESSGSGISPLLSSNPSKTSSHSSP